MTTAAGTIVERSGAWPPEGIDTRPDPEAVLAKRIADMEATQRVWRSQLDQKGVNDLAYSFPQIDPGMTVTGPRILVQYHRPLDTMGSLGLLVKHEATKTQEQWASQIGLVVAFGPLTYRNRKDMRHWWPEGPWCVPGDFIRTPRYGTDRYTVPLPHDKSERVTFGFINENDCLAVIGCNPLDINDFQ